MNKPDDIPQDVWETARATFTECRDANAIWSDGSGPAAIARAIMAEREACAQRHAVLSAATAIGDRSEA